MKTIADFKRKMVLGAKVNSQLFYKDKEGNYLQQNDLRDRVCKVCQSNSFALSMGEKTSWCNWPTSKEFKPINDNTAEIHYEDGKLIYTFV